MLNKGGIDLVTYHKKSYVAGTYKKEKGVITRTKREFIAARNLIEIPQENLMESISIALHPFVMSDYHDTKKTSSYEDDDKRYVNSVGY